MYLKHLYYGNGKGKTTAALGLALRAAGHGMRVHIVQFLKGTDTGELHSLSRLENVTADRCDKNYGFSRSMSETDREEITVCHNELFENAAKLAHSGRIDMLILDEITDAYDLSLIDKKAVETFISGDPPAEIVMTGHQPDSIFIKNADYASEMTAVKHPYQKGIGARKGVEY